MASRNRIYLILALCVNCFILTFLILDSRSINSLDISFDFLPSPNRDGSWPDNHFVKMEEMGLVPPSPPSHGRAGTCGLCSGNATLCKELGLNQAVWNRGTEVRIKRFIQKAMRGEGFTVGVVGGSVSAGHGLNAQKLVGEWTEPTTPHNMHRAIFDHLDTLFPAGDGQVIGGSGGNGKNGFINGAQGATGTDYFSMCFGEHLPEDVDLVLIDAAINDQLFLRNMPSYELLLRGLLDLPNKPAIINVHIFALLFDQMALGGDLHAGLNQFYDIPTISVRGPFLTELLADGSKIREFFVSKGPSTNDSDPIDNVDLRHFSAYGHRRTAELVKAYISWQVCEMSTLDPKVGTLDEMYPIPPLPRQLLMQKYDPWTVVPPLKPTCLSTNGLKHKLEPSENQGWEHWNWEKKHYLRATVPGSRIGIKFTTSLGTVQLHYLRSAIFGLGSLRCWVDDEVDKETIVIAYWKEKYNIGKGITIRDDLSPGEHMLRCELMSRTADPGGGTEFRIISVMSV